MPSTVIVATRNKTTVLSVKPEISKIAIITIVVMLFCLFSFFLGGNTCYGFAMTSVLQGITGALRLSLLLGISAEFWLSMHVKYDLWQVTQKGCTNITRIAA